MRTRHGSARDLRPAAPVSLSPILSQQPIQRKASCACGGGCPSCESKGSDLKVSQPNDTAEIEADRVADKVMRMPDARQMPISPLSSSSPGVYRKCGQCGDEELIQRKKGDDRESGQTSHVDAALRAGGQALDMRTRNFFEPRLGYDLSAVKIHTGEAAHHSARSLNALAYTLDNNIVFAQGNYRPETPSGQKLLAHELAHVVQQGTGAQRKMIQKADDKSFEAGAGLDKGIAKGTMKASSIAGKTYSVKCGSGSYGFSFKFTKAYKGDYPYVSAGKDVRGVYVKIEASLDDKKKVNTCAPMRLLQTLSFIQKGSSGTMEVAKPDSQKRKDRMGWDNASAPSRGWMVDTLDDLTNPYFTNNSPPDAQEGSATKPAILWDAPGQWSTTVNAGMELYTCAVCENAAHAKSVMACVQWGYYIDSSGNVDFRPASPSAACGSNQIVKDSSERWDRSG